MKIIRFFIPLILFSFLLSCKDSKSEHENKIISVQEMQRVLDAENEPQLIDVRTVEEFKEGHIRNSQNICVTDDDFEERVSILDKNKPIYVYCRSGKRSAKAAEILKEMGFKEIYDLDGGFLNWEDSD